MAKISTFKRDKTRIAQGEKIEVGPKEDPFWIITRGIGAAYRDTLARLRLDAARKINTGARPGVNLTTPDTLPPSIDDDCVAQALIAECLLGVEGMENDDGSAMDLDTFRAEMLGNSALISICMTAAGKVGQVRDAEIKAAEGN